MYPKGHPSGRHSSVDWSAPDWDAFPEFEKTGINEVILKAGDMLYVPTDWLHYIVSIGVNMQCNTRSGVDTRYHFDVNPCK